MRALRRDTHINHSNLLESEYTGPHRWKGDSHRILIVDDDQEVATSLADCLTHEGYEVQVATTGMEALPFIRHYTFRPNIILLDLWMPELSGLELLQRYLNSPLCRDILVLALSADELALQAARKCGIVASFPKPIKVDSLLDTIQVFCPVGRKINH